MENTGPPPAEKEMISSLPTVCISQEQTGNLISLICLILGDWLRTLPCLTFVWVCAYFTLRHTHVRTLKFLHSFSFPHPVFPVLLIASQCCIPLSLLPSLYLSFSFCSFILTSLFSFSYLFCVLHPLSFPCPNSACLILSLCFILLYFLPFSTFLPMLYSVLLITLLSSCYLSFSPYLPVFLTLHDIYVFTFISIYFCLSSYLLTTCLSPPIFSSFLLLLSSSYPIFLPPFFQFLPLASILIILLHFYC